MKLEWRNPPTITLGPRSPTASSRLGNPDYTSKDYKHPYCESVECRYALVPVWGSAITISPIGE